MEEKKSSSLKQLLFGSIRNKIIFGFFFAVLLPIIILNYINFNISSDALVDSALSQVDRDIVLHLAKLEFILGSFEEDILFLSETPPIQGIIRSRDNNGVDPFDGSSYDLWKDRLSTIFIEKAKISGAYMQLRYLDKHGNELIRIDSDIGGQNVIRVVEEKLQNKKDRYYFSETMKLNKDEVYISFLDLNKEGSPPTVEIPYKPVIRYGVPLFDVQDNPRGILVINIFADSFLEIFDSGSQRIKTETFLIDKDGFYLFHENKSKVFGGPRDLGNGENVRNDLPDSMLDIAFSNQYQIIYMSEHKHVFGSTSFFPNERNSEEFWVLLEMVPEQLILAPLFDLRTITLIISFVFLALVVFLGFYLSRSLLNPISQLIYGTKQMELGNFNTKIDIRTDDELEKLGEVFNKNLQILKQRDEEHKQLEKSKTEFLSITSHELRSPMTPMQAQLQMLMGEYYGKLNSKQKQAMEIVSRNTKRLDNIIVDFLEISRIEAARLKFRFVKGDPAKCVSRLTKEMAGFMPEKKIKIVTKMEKLPIIEYDPDRLCQILRNLVNNAVKFSKSGMTVEIGGKLQKNDILFWVKDQGEGIKFEDQRRIFEPFFQAEQTIYREHQGTGLGLAIIRGIVESQNGQVWLKSEIGKGTTFYFTLPLKPVLKIRPIKLLFSEKGATDEKIKQIFEDMLGVMGFPEFEVLSRKQQLNKHHLVTYVNQLMLKGILDEQKAEIFKSKILDVFGERKDINK